MSEQLRVPEFVNADGVPFFKDPTGRHSLRGVTGGTWTHLVSGAGGASPAFDVEGCSLLQDVPAPQWSQGSPRPAVVPSGSGLPSGSPAAAGSRQKAAWTMVALGALGLVGGGIWWAWANAQVKQSALIRQADSTAPAVVVLVVSGILLLAGIMVLVTSLPAKE